MPLALRDLEAMLPAGGGGLDKLEWLPAERAFDEDALRVALRTGRPSTAGLVVEAQELAVVDWPKRIKASRAGVADAEASIRPQIEALDAVLPGMLTAHDEVGTAAEQSSQAALARAEAAANEALAAPASPELVAHWTSMGGRLPDPA